jgi:hypothetical protein
MQRNHKVTEKSTHLNIPFWLPDTHSKICILGYGNVDVILGSGTM